MTSRTDDGTGKGGKDLIRRNRDLCFKNPADRRSLPDRGAARRPRSLAGSPARPFAGQRRDGWRLSGPRKPGKRAPVRQSDGTPGADLAIAGIFARSRPSIASRVPAGAPALDRNAAPARRSTPRRIAAETALRPRGVTEVTTARKQRRARGRGAARIEAAGATPPIGLPRIAGRRGGGGNPTTARICDLPIRYSGASPKFMGAFPNPYTGSTSEILAAAGLENLGAASLQNLEDRA